MQKPLDIIHLIYSLEVGGAETMLIDIANGQAHLGHKVAVLIVNDIVCDDLLAKFDSTVEIIRMNRRQGDKPLLLMARLNMLIARRRPDIIHAHHHKFCRLVQVFKKRLVFTVHDINTPMHYAGRSRMIAITDAVRDDILARVPDADIHTIHNGIRVNDIPRRGNTPLKGKLKLVQVARLLAEKKGQDIIIDALALLSRRGITDVEVTFIGDGIDRTILGELAQSNGVADRVHFAGLCDRDTIYSSLCRYDAMCHPSRYEGFGLTIAEGMAAGLPLIVTRNDGPWEVADRGRLCLSVDNGDAGSCADAIEAMLKDYPAALATAAEALEYVKRYDISVTVGNYIAFYRQISGK